MKKWISAQTGALTKMLKSSENMVGGRRFELPTSTMSTYPFPIYSADYNRLEQTVNVPFSAYYRTWWNYKCAMWGTNGINAASSNGRTPDFDSGNRGSNPRAATIPTNSGGVYE